MLYYALIALLASDGQARAQEWQEWQVPLFRVLANQVLRTRLYTYIQYNVNER